MAVVVSNSLDLTVLHEGFRGHPYDDLTGKPVVAPVGKVTIGYGTNVQDAPLTEFEARIIAEHRLTLLVSAYNQYIPTTFNVLNGPRQAALIDMAYAMGFAKVKKFKNMLRALSSFNYGEAAAEIINSDFGRSPLHATRARRVAGMMESGKWPVE